MGDMRGAYRFFVLSHEGSNHLEDLGVDGRIILKWISIRSGMVGHGLGCFCPG
jgi:hypothetical protein